MIRPTRAVEAIPLTTPFIGPEQLMRETGQRELVRLGANESAFGPSPKAVSAMANELPRLSWYGDPESLDLRDALAEKHDCRPQQIVVGAGIDDLMGLAVRAFLAPGDAALVTLGTYPTFAYHVAGYGGRLIEVAYRDDGTPDCDALAATARREQPSIVYLANPDNPSGRFIRSREITAFYEALSPTAFCCSTRPMPISSTKTICCPKASKIGSFDCARSPRRTAWPALELATRFRLRAT